MPVALVVAKITSKQRFLHGFAVSLPTALFMLVASRKSLSDASPFALLHYSVDVATVLLMVPLLSLLFGRTLLRKPFATARQS